MVMMQDDIQTHARQWRWTMIHVTTLLLALLVGPAAAAPGDEAEDQSVWASQAEPKLSFDGEQVRLRWGDHVLFADGLPAATAVALETTSVNPENKFLKYDYEQAPVDQARTTVDPKQGLIRRTYPWGELRVYHTLDGHRLTTRVELENKADKPIADFRIQLATLNIPGKPEKLNPKRGNAVEESTDKLLTHRLDLPQGRLYASYASFSPPIRFGFGNATEGSADEYPMIVGGGVHIQPLDDVVLPPRGIPVIPPGQTLKLRFTMELADKDAQQQDALRELYRDWRSFHSPMLDWPDRRPIGDAYLLSEYGKQAPAFGQEGINPRRWWSPMLNVVEMDSPHGRAMLRKQLQGLAYKTVSVMKQMGGQGVILWNAEGGFHSTGWVGEPRLLPVFNPEMDRAIDDYFQILRDAGLKTGVTIRHGHVVWRGNKWTQNPGNFNPENNATLDDFTKHFEAHPHEPWWRIYPVAERMSNKIAYAKKRWGATIFYVDTSLITRGRGENQRMSHRPIAAHIYRKIREDHPDVLIIPEISGGTSLAHIAPYGQLPYRRVRPKYDGHWTLDLFPTYFGFHRVSDYPVWQTRVGRVHEVAWGEILGMSAWSWSENADAVVDVYKEADAKKRRVTTMARRFGMIDRPEANLPLSYAIRDARPLVTNEIVADPPASGQMRAHAALSDDRSEALVIISFLGYPHAPGVTLKPDLPGLGLEGKLRVWDVESGDLISDGKAIHVPADPVMGMRMLYVRAGDKTDAPLPAGLRLAASFDNGSLTPDQGGGLIDDHGSAPIDGGAVQLRPGQGVAQFASVPDWNSGTLAFDLNVGNVDNQTFPLVQLRHHIDGGLELIRHNGKPAIRLFAHERGVETIGREEDASLGADVKNGFVRREAVAPLAGDGWHHVTLTWDVGQYRLFIDGKQVALLSAPAYHRWRDGTVLEPGLVFGGGESGDTHAQVDSVTLYDWTVGEPQLAERTGRVGVKPIARPDQRPVSVWLWGDDPKNADRVAVNVQPTAGGDRAVRMKVELYEKLERGMWKLAETGTEAIDGAAVLRLDYDPAAPPADAMEVQEDRGGGDGVLGDALGEIMADAKTYVLRVKVNVAGAADPTRDIEFQFPPDRKVHGW